jgi:hypothetical protein
MLGSCQISRNDDILATVLSGHFTSVAKLAEFAAKTPSKAVI